MKLFNSSAEIFAKTDAETALKRTTALSIGAHQDDLEIMSYGAIANCYGQADKHFTGVVVTDGDGSPRIGVYGTYTNDEMKKVRVVEQKNAAAIGDYSAVVLLSYKSGEVKDPTNQTLINEIKELILTCEPEILYTHNLADKHDTHVAVAMHVIRALREIPVEKRPKKIVSMEVWRSLDWLNDEDKYVEDTAKFPNIASALLGVFDSQVSGGKRYDLAALGRRVANATFFASHSVDEFESASFGLDITELVNSDAKPVDFILKHIEKFKDEVKNRVENFS